MLKYIYFRKEEKRQRDACVKALMSEDEELPEVSPGQVWYCGSINFKVPVSFNRVANPYSFTESPTIRAIILE
jgi:hypothetical protein